ncbi:hypothetical protein [Candidatus Uabimicrobium sp. HlEnr_7]|uniref:hypothetical protein n=1 Tax=Candidatus Uabimicrobium helgolandensis TaxID=3095367 RepID=UPI0035574B72
MRLLVTILFMSILLVSCVSTQVDNDASDVNNSQSDTTNNDNQTSDNTNSDNTNSDNTNNNDNIDNSSNNDNTDNIINNDTNNNNQQTYIPPQPSTMEENVLSSSNINELIVADGDDEDWEKFREAYIVQYLKDFRLVPGSLNKEMPKEVLEYLNKGYGMYRTPITGIEKEVEYGFLSARAKDVDGLEKHLSVMASQGKGKDYYSLAYIAAWAYAKNGAKDKAQTLVQKENLINNVPAFGLDVPQEDLQNLQASIQ